MERIVYGWQTAGVCDRLTAMLLIWTSPGAGIAQKEDTNDPHDRVLC